MHIGGINNRADDVRWYLLEECQMDPQAYERGIGINEYFEKVAYPNARKHDEAALAGLKRSGIRLARNLAYGILIFYSSLNLCYQATCNEDFHEGLAWHGNAEEKDDLSDIVNSYK